MAIICTPEYLDRVAKENPEMTLEDVKDFAQMERDYQDLVYEMTHQ